MYAFHYNICTQIIMKWTFALDFDLSTLLRALPIDDCQLYVFYCDNHYEMMHINVIMHPFIVIFTSDTKRTLNRILRKNILLASQCNQT